MMISGARERSHAPTAVPQRVARPRRHAHDAQRHGRALPGQRVLAQQERQEEDQEAGEAAQGGVGAQRVGDRGADRAQPGALDAAAALRPVQVLLVRREQGAVSSPLAESTFGGSVNDRNVPATKITNAPYSGQRGPSGWSPAPMGAATPVASSPPSVTRELAFTRENAGGSSRGTTALLTTPYAFEATSTPSAAGYSSMLPRDDRPGQHQREQRAGEHRAGHRGAAAVRQPVQERADHGREER